MKKIAVYEYLLLLVSTILVGCDPVSPPDPLSLTDAELRSFTHCKVSFQCELVNCAVVNEPFGYKWKDDTMTYRIEWDSTGFYAQEKYSNSKDWIDVDQAGSHYGYYDFKSIRSFMFGDNNLVDSILLTHDYRYSYHAQHINRDHELNDFAKCSSITLMTKTPDSLVYYVGFNSNPERLDTASFSSHGHDAGYYGSTTTCGISWQNNAESYIRLVLFKQ